MSIFKRFFFKVKLQSVGHIQYSPMSASSSSPLLLRASSSIFSRIFNNSAKASSSCSSSHSHFMQETVSNIVNPSSTLCRRHGFSSCSTVCLSYIGKRELRYDPSEVSISIGPIPVPNPSFPRASTHALVKGPKGQLSLPLEPFIHIDFPTQTGKDGSSGSGGGGGGSSGKQSAVVRVANETDKTQRAMWGTTRTLLSNMIEGVSVGFTVPIRMNGVGYRAQLETVKTTSDQTAADGTITPTPTTKQQLVLRLGFSHPVILDVPPGIQVTVPVPQRIILQGIDVAQVTQFAANIRKHRPPEPYNQKGVFVGDETIKKKEGKKR